MMLEDERRTAGISRVPVKTLVEMCGRDITGAPAFEAEAIDVSGRGMHVRTAYLPEAGSELVIRMEDQGREIIAEGRVVWRKEAARGGEFGIMFTALDSGSVAALRELCGQGSAAGGEPAGAKAAGPPDPAERGNDAGSRVRLHIDGLGAPMKALVREAAKKKLKVGSNLEFLKVGRHLEIENLDQTFRRGAYIDSLDVVVDPQTGVPQLVVALHYDDVEDNTPEPSVVDRPIPEKPRAESKEPRTAAAPESEVQPFEAPDPAEEVMEEAHQLRGRLGTAAVSAGRVAKQGGEVLARLSTRAAKGMGVLFQEAGGKVLDLSRRKSTKGPVRTTSALPVGMALGTRYLRPQVAGARSRQAEKSADGAATSPKPKLVRRIAAGAALVVLVTAVGVLATRRGAAPPGAIASASQPLAVVSVAAADPKPERLVAPAPPGSVVADVPLFGPTPMATMEPAPLGPAPEGSTQLTSSQRPPLAEQKADAPGIATDETFEDSHRDAATPDSGKEKDKPSPADVKPWGRGTVKTPTIHRLRLDGPGTAIKGEISSSGFAVFLPGRKVMEDASGIAKRDKRIARVTAQNSGSGARVHFRFRDGVPGYRVRLRKDFVEFLLSAPIKK